MGYANVYSATISGTTSIPVNVECDISSGPPAFRIIGAHHSAIAEIQELVKCAIRSAGFAFPDETVTVNLSPNEIPKTASQLELAIATSILEASSQIDKRPDTLFVGELTLDGNLVKSPRGIIAHMIHAYESNYRIVCPKFSYPLTHLENTDHVFYIENIRNLRNLSFSKPEPLNPNVFKVHTIPSDIPDLFVETLNERKSMLLIGDQPRIDDCIHSLQTLLPPLTDTELTECAAIASCADDELLPYIVAGRRPIRIPHHSISSPGMLGGGNPIAPGEITLAHHGVLVLRDIDKFSLTIVEAVMRAHHDKKIDIVRASGNTSMPARFQLIATAKPCPCGNYGNPNRPCTCSAASVDRYQSHLMQMIDKANCSIINL